MENSKLTGNEMLKIASASGVDVDGIDPDQLEMGYDVELEHGTISPDTDVTDDDVVKTIKIAITHLREKPDYYTLLKKYVEKETTENMINENNKRFQELLGIKSKNGTENLISENFVNNNKDLEDMKKEKFEMEETQYADGKVEMMGIDESYFVNEEDLFGGEDMATAEVDEEEKESAIDYFVKTFYNGQFSQLRILAKEMKEKNEIMGLYRQLKDMGEEKIIDWLFKWLIEG